PRRRAVRRDQRQPPGRAPCEPRRDRRVPTEPAADPPRRRPAESTSASGDPLSPATRPPRRGRDAAPDRRLSAPLVRPRRSVRDAPPRRRRCDRGDLRRDLPRGGGCRRVLPRPAPGAHPIRSPLAVYSDRHGLFVRADNARDTRAEELAGVSEPTQLGRAFAELAVETIFAHSPQAKGRVERAFGTIQDRLVSELRLAKGGTIAQANR